MKRAFAGLLLATVACTGGGDPGYSAEQLRFLVLSDAPEGTLPANGEPEIDLDDLAQDDDERRSRFEQAGFEAGYEATYVSSSIAPRFQGFRMTSRAYLFSDPTAGLEAIRTTIEREGSQLVERSEPFLGRPGFTLRGRIDAALPRGIVLAWQKENVILLLAVVAISDISEAELRQIAGQIDELEPPVHPVTT